MLQLLYLLTSGIILASGVNRSDFDNFSTTAHAYTSPRRLFVVRILSLKLKIGKFFYYFSVNLINIKELYILLHMISISL